MSDIGERFLDACIEQKVNLYGPLDTSIALDEVPDDTSIALDEVEYRPHISAQEGVLIGVIAAAQYLEKRPRLKLAEHPLDTDAFEDMPSRLLAELINRSLGVDQQREPALSVRRPAEYENGTCPLLEKYWKETFDEMEKGQEGVPMVQIFTLDDEPVVLRKGRGEPTALLLKDAAVGRKKVVYPAGSAVDISTRMDSFDHKSGRVTMLSSVPEVLPVSAIRTMSFRRLTPYAVPEEQRGEHFGVLRKPHKPIKEIRALAQKAARRNDAYSVEDISLPRHTLNRVTARLRAA